jgi:hypothetical protein
MPFDGAEVVYTREIGRVDNVPKVIAFIERHGDHFDMHNPSVCVMGMAARTLGMEWWRYSETEIGARLGMSRRQSRRAYLEWPILNWSGQGKEMAARAVKMLRYYQRTGKICWSPIGRLFGMGLAF